MVLQQKHQFWLKTILKKEKGYQNMPSDVTYYNHM